MIEDQPLQQLEENLLQEISHINKRVTITMSGVEELPCGCRFIVPYGGCWDSLITCNTHRLIHQIQTIKKLNHDKFDQTYTQTYCEACNTIQRSDRADRDVALLNIVSHADCDGCQGIATCCYYTLDDHFLTNTTFPCKRREALAQRSLS